MFVFIYKKEPIFGTPNPPGISFHPLEYGSASFENTNCRTKASAFSSNLWSLGKQGQPLCASENRLAYLLSEDELFALSLWP